MLKLRGSNRLTAKYCTNCGNKLDETNFKTKHSNSEKKFIEDVPFNGTQPLLFKIKRIKNGRKFEIKNEQGKKVFEAKMPFKTGMMVIRNLSKMFDKALVGDYKDITVFVLHDPQKESVGEIVINTADIFNLQKGIKYLKPVEINNSNGELLALLDISYKERIDMFVSGRNHEKKIDQDHCSVETNLGKFTFEILQEIHGKFSKTNLVVKVEILDSNLNNSISIVKTNKNNYEMRLYQGFSPLIAQSLTCLISHVMWPPPKASMTTV